MTRIIAGVAKGRKLEVPGRGTRPTSDKVRGAIFSRLQSWGVIEQARVLDLFAGSGALGLEALSRGAHSAVLVEKAPPAARIAKRNADSLGLGEDVKIIVSDAKTYLLGNTGDFDLVFLDPPYALPEVSVTEVLIALVPRLDVDATIVVERDGRSKEPTLPEGLEVINSKRWGDTAAWFLKVAGSET